jgi:tetratricopeptide (TPR) repeat protein
MLTGRPPFLAATQMETLDQVRHQEPVPPSRLQPKVPRDLETICLKCLEKESQRRYGNALALAEDLHRFLANEPIQARPVRWWERGLKWANRRPAIAALIAVSAMALLSSVAWGLLYLDQRNRALQQQVNDAHRREEVQQFILESQRAFTNKELESARVNLAGAQAKLGPFEPSLRELHEQVWALRDAIEHESERLKARQSARKTYEEFMRQHDEALFHATLATGEGELANLNATREAVGNALSLFGVTLDAQVPLRLKSSFLESEQTDILAGCYELLLILAQTEVQQPGQKLADEKQLRLALHILDRAANLGYSGHATQAYHLRRARYLEQLGNKAEADKQREQAETRPPATALDYYLVGDEHYKQEKMQEATQDFLRAVERQPDHFWARYFLALSYLRLERPSPELAMAHLTFCIKQKADFIWLYLLRGFAHTQLQDFRAAEADFKKAWQLLEKKPSKDAGHVLYATRGVLWSEQGELGKAVEDLQEAIRLKPREYQAYVTLAHVYQKQKQWDQAQAQLDKAVELAPDLAFLYRLRARIHLERPDHLDAALRDCEKAIEAERALAGVSSPALAKDYAEKGRILHRSHRHQEAVAAYDVAIKIDRSYANAHLWRAQVQFELPNYREAAHSFDEYLKQGGKPLVELFRQRGFARAQLGDYPQAIEDYTQVLAMEPNHAATQTTRGWAYLATGSYQLAQHDFEEAIRLRPQNGDAYNGRGYARVRLGQYREAVEDAKAALKRGSENASRLYYDAARIYAQAVGKAQADPRPLSRQGMAWYQERAVVLIRQALESLPPKERERFWRDTIQLDNALSPIRGSTAFIRLASEYSHWTK